MSAPRGLYTPIYGSLPRHPKVLAASVMLRIDRHKLIGHLVCLWTWCLDSIGDDRQVLSAEAVALAAEWPDRKARAFADALADVGFLHHAAGGYTVHEWGSYGGKIATGRVDDRSRHNGKRRAYQDGTIAAVRDRDGDYCRYCGREVDWADRKTSRGGCYDHVVPHPLGDFSLENLVVCCRGCNTRKRDRTPEQAGMALLPPSSASSNAAPDPHLIDETRQDETRRDEMKREDPDPLPVESRWPPQLLRVALSEPQRAILDSLHEQVERLVYMGTNGPGIGFCEDLILRGATRTDVDFAVQAGLGKGEGYVRKVLERRVSEREAGRDPDARARTPNAMPRDPAQSALAAGVVVVGALSDGRPVRKRDVDRGHLEDGTPLPAELRA